MKQMKLSSITSTGKVRKKPKKINYMFPTTGELKKCDEEHMRFKLRKARWGSNGDTI